MEMLNEREAHQFWRMRDLEDFLFKELHEKDYYSLMSFIEMDRNRRDVRIELERHDSTYILVIYHGASLHEITFRT